MKVVIQRVTRASVTIEQQLFSSIGKGMLILVGIQSDDTDDDINEQIRFRHKWRNSHG